MKVIGFLTLTALAALAACNEDGAKSPAKTTSPTSSAPTTASATSAAQSWSPEELAKKKRSLEGSVTLEGKTLQLKEAVAHWDPDKRVLAIEMLAYELDAANFVKACTRGTFFTDRPDAVAPWDWVPAATIYVTFRKDAKTFDASSIKELRLNAYHMRKKNETVFIHRPTDKIASELTKLSGMTGPGAVIDFAFGGEEPKKPASWTLKGIVPVCVKSK